MSVFFFLYLFIFLLFIFRFLFLYLTVRTWCAVSRSLSSQPARCSALIADIAGLPRNHAQPAYKSAEKSSAQSSRLPVARGTMLHCLSAVPGQRWCRCFSAGVHCFATIFSKCIYNSRGCSNNNQGNRSKITHSLS